ncbi:protein VAC14 homolog isoform X2 [Symsagittifera roscoffensis]|uniref:protein VAC14 homolog isoform X2 n=1 Tax=Symsagittifera roscoffensis TaxID=84072 RepID=UPI00307B71E0
MSASIHSNASPMTTSTSYPSEPAGTGNYQNSGAMGMSSDVNYSPLPPSIARNLNDRLYEKRKQAALEIEKLVRGWVSTEHPNQCKNYVQMLISCLQKEYLYRGSNPHTRKGGLIGLAATAIALGYKEVHVHLVSLINPVVDCFNDQDPRVRYYGCEALFNISKVARAHIMPHVGKIFDGLCKLAADEDANVRNGTELLDKLMQDTVAEHVDKFDVITFVPMLTAKLKSNDKQIALFLVKWIVALNSRPNSHLLKYLPQLLEGLFGFLALDDEVVYKATEECLKEFLNEVRERPESVQYASMVNTIVYHSKPNQLRVQKMALLWQSEFVKCAGREMLPFLSNMLQAILPILSLSTESVTAELVRLAHEVNSDLQHLITEADDAPDSRMGMGMGMVTTSPGSAGAAGNFTSLQVITNHTGAANINHSGGGGGGGVAESLTSVSSSSIDDQDSLEQIRSRPGGPDSNGPTLVTFGIGAVEQHHSDQHHSQQQQSTRLVPHPVHAPQAIHPHSHHVQLDVKDTVDTLAQLINQNQGQNKLIPTQEACLDWLFKLYSTVPHKMFICTENIFPTLIALVRTPSSASERDHSSRDTASSHLHHRDTPHHSTVHEKVLKVLAEIASSAAAPLETSSDITCPSQRNVYFRSLLRRLLESFAAYPDLTELDRSHGLFIIRNLCALLSARDVYRTLSELLLLRVTAVHHEDGQDRQFVSKMVNLLNTILMTTHELYHLRDELKHFKLPDTRDLFTCVYRTWCLCPVAAVSLCLLSGKYRHACRLLHLFGSLEIDVDILNEVDKLVQLLESPIFANLRLQMLEMSDSEQPHLVKAMYSLLMLLPQTAAYSLLKDRLSCIPSPQLMPTGGCTSNRSGGGGMNTNRSTTMVPNSEGGGGGDDELTAATKSPLCNGPSELDSVHNMKNDLHDRNTMSPSASHGHHEDIDSDALLDYFRAFNVASDGTPNGLYTTSTVPLHSTLSPVGGIGGGGGLGMNRGPPQNHMNYFRPLQKPQVVSSQSQPPNSHMYDPTTQGSTTVSDV